MTRSRRTSWLIRAAALAGVAVLFWLFPAFHVVSLKATQQQTVAAAFDASAFVEKLWVDQLTRPAGRAIDAATLLAEIGRDPKAARLKHGRTAGLGSTYYYHLTGEGRVLSADARAVAIAVTAGSSTPEVVIELGNVFGNAVRDGTGVADVSRFADSQDFNAISSEINRRIEERVLPPLRAGVTPGSTVSFTGCAEVTDEEADLHPLRVIPLSAVVR